MQRNIEILLGHLRTAAPLARAKFGYQASDSSQVWAISTQTLDGKLTGKIILVCDDEGVLSQFTEAARAEGHTVDPAGPENTVLITPSLDDDCPLMCVGCPVLPKGVRARLISAETVTMAWLRQFRFAREMPQAAERMAGRIRVTAQVTTSDNPAAEVGATARMSITDPGSGAAGIAELIKHCQGPKWFFSFWRLVFKRVCGCLGPQLRDDL